MIFLLILSWTLNYDHGPCRDLQDKACLFHYDLGERQHLLYYIGVNIYKLGSEPDTAALRKHLFSFFELDTKHHA